MAEQTNEREQTGKHRHQETKTSDISFFSVLGDFAESGGLIM